MKTNKQLNKTITTTSHSNKNTDNRSKQKTSDRKCNQKQLHISLLLDSIRNKAMMEVIKHRKYSFQYWLFVYAYGAYTIRGGQVYISYFSSVFKHKNDDSGSIITLRLYPFRIFLLSDVLVFAYDNNICLFRFFILYYNEVNSKFE